MELLTFLLLLFLKVWLRCRVVRLFYDCMVPRAYFLLHYSLFFRVCWQETF